MSDNNCSVITKLMLSIPTDIIFITRKFYVAVHQLGMCIIETLKWSLYEYVWFVWICVIHMNSAHPPLTLLLLIKLSNRKLIIIATAHFVEVPLYPHIKLDSVETSQRLHVWIVHPCLIKQIFCCPTWLFLTYYAESSVETEHEIETHSLLFFCSFLRANNNSLSTRNSYYRSTRSFSPVNQDCGDTALVNCPVWCSLDLDWCSQPSALVNWGLLHSMYLRCLGTGFKTPRPLQTRGSVTAGFGCTLHCCVRDKEHCAFHFHAFPRWDQRHWSEDASALHVQ